MKAQNHNRATVRLKLFSRFGKVTKMNNKFMAIYLIQIHFLILLRSQKYLFSWISFLCVYLFTRNDLLVNYSLDLALLQLNLRIFKTK